MKKDKLFYGLPLYFFSLLFLQLILVNLVNPEKILAYSLGLIMIYLIVLFIFILINKDDLKVMLKDFKQHYRKYLKTGLIYWLFGFALMLITNYVINFIVFKGGIAPNEELVRNDLTKYLFAYFIINSFLAPFLEELVFRLNFKTIKNKYLYLFITSFIFALMHILGDIKNFIYVVPYLVLGLTFGLCYYKTQNIYTSVIIHILHNTLVCLLLIF